MNELHRQVDLALFETLAAKSEADRARARRLRLEALHAIEEAQAELDGYRLLLALFPTPSESALLIGMAPIPEPYESN